MRITARHRVVVVAVAAALGLAGCTSDDDGADGTAGTGSVAIESDGPTTAASSGAVGASGDTAADTESPAESAAGDTTSEEAAMSSGSVAMPSPTSVQPSSRSPKPTPSTPKPSGSGVVDEFSQTDTAWFGAMCSGLVDKPERTLPELADQDLQARKPAAAALFTDQADRLDAAVEFMKQADPPSISDGDKLSESVQETFPKIAEAARSGASAISAAGDDEEYQKAVDQARDAMNTAASDLVAFDEMMAAPAMIAQLRQVPECALLLDSP